MIKMDAAEFLKEKKRMCTRICGGKDGCVVCELSSCKNGKKCTCKDFIDDFPEEAVAVVEKWSKEHPQAQACGCDTCDKKLTCTGLFKRKCENSRYSHYNPDPRVANADGNKECDVPERPNKPECFIIVVITDEAKRAFGVQSNVYLFTSVNFEVVTTSLCGKEFVQVREIKTGKPTLILDASTVLAIDYEYRPMTYCV